MKKRFIAFALFLALLFSMTGVLTACEVASAKSVDLMQDIQANEVTTEVEMTGDGAVAVTDFAVRLFQNSMTVGESSLISPVSVLYALAMTANGAKGESRTQMEEVLGEPVEELNEYLHVWLGWLSRRGERYRLSIANAIWFKDVESFTVNEDFLQINADYYGAGIYKAPFDKGTCRDINRWVSQNTDEMIDGIIDEIPGDAVMYLVNALSFDAEWGTVYRASQVRGGVFTSEKGNEQQADFMYSTLREYLEDDLATGFVKQYAGGRYAFVAMLPKDGVCVAEYVQSLTGEHLQKLLSESQSVEVRTSLPKFEAEYEADLSEVLKTMGMTRPFVSGLEGVGTSTEDIYMAISRVLHKTFIAVDERGTKAGAATAVEMNPTSAPPPEEYKEVYLDRPFVYMIVDCVTNVPIFVGTVMELNVK